MNLESAWKTNGGFKRTFHLEDESGNIIKEFEDNPTLPQLRNAERQEQERLVLTDIGIPCVNCASEITDRFASDPRGNLLCWNCAVTRNHEIEAGIRVNTDSSESTISSSQLYKKSLCEYVVNVATGCRHGCKFCYVPTTPGYETRENLLEKRAGVNDRQAEWGNYLLYRDDLPERLHSQLENNKFSKLDRTERGRGVVMLSSGTDPYQDRRAGQISRATINELLTNDIPVRVLTRSSIVVKDMDLFQEGGEQIKIGSSIPTFNHEIVSTLEPGAPPPHTRWETLDMLQQEGIPIFVSMSPTYPTLDEHMLHRLLTRFIAINPDVVFHEPINPRGENFDMMVETLEEAGFSDAVAKFERLHDSREWVEYALKHLNWVQEKSLELGGPPIHSWPDSDLLKATKGRLHDQLVTMRKSPSPESFSEESPTAQDSAHSPLFDSFEDIEDLIVSENIS